MHIRLNPPFHAGVRLAALKGIWWAVRDSNFADRHEIMQRNQGF